MPIRLAALVLSVLVWGCTQQTPPQTIPKSTAESAPSILEQPQAAPSIPAALSAVEEEPDGVPPEVIRPEQFLRDLRQSEIQASRVSKWLKSWCDTLRQDNATPMSRFLSRRFRAQWFGPSSHSQSLMGVRVTGRMARNEWINKQTFVSEWRSLTQRWSQLDRCRVKVWQFRVTPNERYAWAQMRFTLAGDTKIGEKSTIRGEFDGFFDLKYNRVLAVKGTQFQRLVRTKPLFYDVSEQVGIRLHRSQLTTDMVQEDIDGNRLETIGGLAVLDWNQDGRDDLAVWNRRRTFQVFVNDGEGGFNTILNPIPSDAVGLFHLYVDLDGNGHPELLSTEFGGCEDGRAWFRTFEHRGDTIVNRGRVFEFDLDCDRYGLVRYQHIAAADIDSDGDLDLIFAGFDNRNSMRQRRNQFQGNDGQRNLVFFNDGQLSYREASQDNGFDASRYTYVSTFFDYDRDGDDDLYVVNDYGVNQLFLNNGRGQFIETTDPGLTANGQSMGVTVADLDGDLDFEVYVSNMYSYAGNRIVPLTDDRLSAGTFSELLSLAKGNSAFKRMKDGNYRDVAGTLGLARGGWSWGQTIFDPDNDGHWDVYVVNGNASHRDARAPDY